MKKTIRKSITFLTLGTAVFFACCQNDEIGKLEQDSAVSDAREWLESNPTSLEALKYAKTISWENAIILNNNGEQAIEVPLKLAEGATANVVQDEDFKTYMRLLLIKNADSSYKVFDIVYTTKDNAFNNEDKTFNILTLGSKFSGYITIQKNDNSIAYSAEFDNGEFSGLHNYSVEPSTTNRLVCTYYVTVGPYTTCSNWVWYPDYTSLPGGNLPPGYMPGITGPLWPNGYPYPPIDPCAAAVKASGVAANAGFASARDAIAAAGAADGNEHSITLGTPGASGTYTNSAIRTNGNPNGVSVNESLAGAFAAIHNHPNNTALSSGDIYAAVTLNTKNTAFSTSFIITGGETYAIVVNNLAQAQAFVKQFPPDLSPNYPPEFPDAIFNPIFNITSEIGNSIDSKTAAIGSVLDQNNAGITLMKLGPDGKFTRIKIQKNPNGTYSYVPC
ncbi:hypothetical protein FLA105534_01520 [Flavobacterium bizetiae]|uniref:Uncharacterized protein n=1 Tax=Flavobacterium bizetiae TaxID=2704140 RepID=A0A6J4GD92_9FLAO|nr:hypothetical protein [Flavobacterium bizetiae]CAA9197210.1 hypothetical protein FLA105534_01520 [Flavobacterium bizetiae]CAD5342620.1 hypothetical protein FLA105535_02608 [Flavobacterium bizetiae]CAD5348155.1 hypothetical protein FLA105534_02114 [Flavobacterium bizetiae]